MAGGDPDWRDEQDVRYSPSQLGDLEGLRKQGDSQYVRHVENVGVPRHQQYLQALLKSPSAIYDGHAIHFRHRVIDEQ
jgi:hypothetical protein